MTSLESLSPAEFCAFSKTNGISRAWFVWDRDSQTVQTSHPVLEPLAQYLGTQAPDFDRHEGIFLQTAPETGVLQGAFIHRTCRGQAAGGARFWRYDTLAGYLRDGLRLAKGMTQKNALAGIWWGGGKGVLAHGTGRDTPEMRKRIYEEYGEFVTSLRGCYVTAEDVGTNVSDMAAIFSRTRFTTCIPESLGGSGNPSVPTALGVVRGMEAALAHLEMGSLAGKSVSVMGLGNVGEPLIGYLRQSGVKRISGSDIEAGRIEKVKSLYPDLDLDLRLVPPGDTSLFSAPADILSPCAVGAVLNRESIPAISAKVVCGAANNQLDDPEHDDSLLAARGILYLPDFLVNRMGIVTCADESFGYVEKDPAIERHLSHDWENGVYQVALRVLDDSRRTGSTPHRIARQLADEKATEPHPLWGHRGQLIINSLRSRGWEKGN